jgi:GT2 family glycosyltransferase
MNIRISIVVYQPDLKLLRDVIGHLAAAAAELRRLRGGDVCLDIVNNNPRDDTFPQVRGWLDKEQAAGAMRVKLIDSPGNIGYGAANNISIKNSAGADFHLVLNPDVLVELDTLLNAVDFMEANLNVGLLTPKVLGFDGEVHHLCKRNPSLFDMFLRSFAPGPLRRVFARRMDEFLMLDCDYGTLISPVRYPSGCFMFFRADLLRKINGFDEWFFMYLEDADIGRRILQCADVVYVPSVVIRHQWARGTHNNWRLRWITVVSALKYWHKWGGTFVGAP